MKLFLICGYGIPKDVDADENQRTYLNVAFNRVYSEAAGEEAVIIPCGGPTSMEPPYQGTEAEVIGAYVRKLADQANVDSATASWEVVMEDRSLSTLENLLFAKRIIDDRDWHGPVTIFCEESRRERVETVGREIFGPGVRIEPIDFDISKNRYLDPEILRTKERAATQESLWTLEKPERLERHHAFFERKFAFFRMRQAQGVSHADVVEEWYRFTPELLAELMPDHPLLKQLGQQPESPS